MASQHNTRGNRTYEEWFSDCNQWWDYTRGEEAYNYSYLDWRRWYDEGLTVEQAVERADAAVFGGRRE